MPSATPINTLLLCQLATATSQLLESLLPDADLPQALPPGAVLAIEQARAAVLAAEGAQAPPATCQASPPSDLDARSQLREVRAGLGVLLPWLTAQSAPGSRWPRLCAETLLALPVVAHGLPSAPRAPASARFAAADIQSLRPDWDDATAQAWLARHGKTIESRMVEVGWDVIEALLASEPAATA